MKRQRRTVRTAHLSLPRAAIALLALFAFTLQSFVTQTHLHFIRDANDIALEQMIGGAGDVSAKAKARAGNESQHCPICEEMWLAGTYVTPAAAFLALPHATVSVVEVVLSAPQHVQAVSHDWRGRAPPRR